MFGKFMRDYGWKIIMLLIVIFFVLIADTTLEVNREQQKDLMELENRVIQQDVEIDDLKQTNDQLRGDLNLASEYIELLKSERGE